MVNLIGLRNKNILYFKTSFLKFVNSKNIFIFELPLNYYSKLSFFYLNTLSNRLLKSSYDEIFNYKYKNIQCGKYSISSAIRILRTPEINLKNRRHYIVVKFFLIKSIMLADASINYLNKNKKIEYAVFNDKSYVGAGELFDQCIHNKIKCIYDEVKVIKNGVRQASFETMETFKDSSYLGNPNNYYDVHEIVESETPHCSPDVDVDTSSSSSSASSVSSSSSESYCDFLCAFLNSLISSSLSIVFGATTLVSLLSASLTLSTSLNFNTSATKLSN